MPPPMRPRRRDARSPFISSRSLLDSQKSLINFSALSFFLSLSFLTPAPSLSHPPFVPPPRGSLSLLYLFQFAGSLSASLIAALSRDRCILLRFLIGQLSNPSSPSFPLSSPPSIPLILSWLLCLFFFLSPPSPFVCSDRPLPLIDSWWQAGPPDSIMPQIFFPLETPLHCVL